MIISKALKDDLVRQVKLLENDLSAQVEAVTDVRDRLSAEYQTAFDRKRTAATWTAWLDERVTQTAAAWVLGTVFVRFCEDNDLLEQHYLTGPSQEIAMLAEEAHEEYFRSGTTDLTDRGWLLTAFAELGRSPAGKLLFDQKHNALFQIRISHDAARDLIAFWRARDVSGELVHSFVSDDWDTRFLGDLYQDLSESARKTYALLQTPDFVEEFILDLTLTPAIRDFGGHDVIKMIDPTCGSGHFVLGAFHRLLAEWREHNPMLDRTEHVRLALDQVHGVDINPFAVAIARFRLLIAAMCAAGFTRLADLKKHDLGPLNLAIGDSLLNYDQRTIPGIDKDEALAEFTFTTEDITDHYPNILDIGQYHVVVGNPPYITVEDEILNRRYRDLYSTCYREYHLSVPFIQRFFELAIKAIEFQLPTGRISAIIDSAFMKREFGRRLIENFFERSVELTHVIDTSGAYIPGHGTPTIILAGRNCRVSGVTTVRTVLGVRGEPSEPETPAEGLVWNSIVRYTNCPGFDGEWVSVTDRPRDYFARFPWSLSGGAASRIIEELEVGRTHLQERISSIGYTGQTNSDDSFLVPVDLPKRFDLPRELWREFLTGDGVRNYNADTKLVAIFPYRDGSLVPIDSNPELLRFMWPNRTPLGARATFGRSTYRAEGRPWWEWHQVARSRLSGPVITWAFVQTHNNFAFLQDCALHNRHAPVIKLLEEATGDNHLELLGVLNSSTACFWLKQVCHGKGNGGVNEGYRGDEWEEFYEFTGTKLQKFPLPERLPLERGRKLDQLAQRLDFWNPEALVAREVPTFVGLKEAREAWLATRGQMIAAQEELDWEVYDLYGLTDAVLTAPGRSVPELKLDERAFEIVLARKITRGEAETQWFVRHGSTPITELPEHWPDEYRAVVERRIALIESDRNIGLVERPECKRRWATEGFDALRKKALRSWLLDRFETRELWLHEVDGVEQPRLLTLTQLADALRCDEDVVSVAELYTPGKNLARVVAELIDSEHVPYLAALRYKPAGLRKRAAWEDVWDKQRQEDAAESAEEALKIRDSIPVPPKYASTDFLKASYWKNRGKLDVPKERFISYPYAGKDGAATAKDGTLLLGWAGFDHRQQAQALAALIVEREQDDGWDAARLTPLLAGLREVLPWVQQWHGEFDPNYGTSPAEAYEGFLAQTAAQFNLTDEDLASWTPPASRRGRVKK